MALLYIVRPSPTEFPTKADCDRNISTGLGATIATGTSAGIAAGTAGTGTGCVSAAAATSVNCNIIAAESANAAAIWINL